MKFQSLLMGLLAVVSANPFPVDEDSMFNSLALEQRAQTRNPKCTTTRKKPQPKGILCNAVGRVLRPSRVDAAGVTFARCKDATLRNDGLLSFSYGPNGYCTVYNATIAAMGFQQKKGGLRFYSRKCFDRTCTCPTGFTLCSDIDECVDTQNDELNCGGCGQACPAGAICSQGACLST